MRKFIFAFILLLLAGGCFAASVEVEQAVPAGTVWSFSVSLPNGQDFDGARVLLDGSTLVSFTSPSDKIVSYDEDSSRLFSITDPENGKVYFLVLPLEKGDHVISLEVDGSQEAEEEVDFFGIFDAESSTSLKEQIDGVKNSVAGLIEQYNKLEDKLKAALTEEDKQQLQSSISSVESSVSQLEAAVEEQGEGTNTKIQGLVNDMLSMRQETAEQPVGMFAGFASLGEVPPETASGVLAIIIVIGAAILLVKFRDWLPFKKGLYGKAGGKEMSFSKRDEDIAGQVMSESHEEASKGKWAFGKEKPVKQEKKRFNIGDLIRKD